MAFDAYLTPSVKHLWLAQAIVSIIDSNPVKARSNPTILIKKDEDYTKVFNSEYDIKIFYYAILMRNRVSEYLKSIQKNKSDDAVLINIAKCGCSFLEI